MVSKLKILPQDIVSRAPSSFVVLGSNDGNAWTQLLSVDKSKNAPKINQWLEYLIPHPNYYSQYKMIINDNFGDPDHVTIRSIRMLAKKKLVHYPVMVQSNLKLNVEKNKVKSNKIINSVVFINRSYNRVKLEVKSATDGWLIWREPYGLNWSVQVDGKSQKYNQADIAFIAIPILEGSHKVEISFKGNANFLIKYKLIILLNMISIFIILFFALKPIVGDSKKTS
jgi:hypothetical protein